MMAAGVLLPSAMPGDRRLAFLISYGTMNNVLMLIVSVEFFPSPRRSWRPCPSSP
ncbi:MAG: hypothetical protein V8Q84_11700 [Bilophila sp.]